MRQVKTRGQRPKPRLGSRQTGGDRQGANGQPQIWKDAGSYRVLQTATRLWRCWQTCYGVVLMDLFKIIITCHEEESTSGQYSTRHWVLLLCYPTWQNPSAVGIVSWDLGTPIWHVPLGSRPEEAGQDPIRLAKRRGYPISHRGDIVSLSRDPRALLAGCMRVILERVSAWQESGKWRRPRVL